MYGNEGKGIIADLESCVGGVRSSSGLRNSEAVNSGTPNNNPVAQTQRWGIFRCPSLHGVVVGGVVAVGGQRLRSVISRSKGGSESGVTIHLFRH